MNTNTTDVVKGTAVVAIAQQENKLQAVCLRKEGTAFEVLWTKSCDLTESTWRLFAEECGLSTQPTGQTATDDDRIVVAGFNSEATVFYRIDVPVVRQEEIAAMVRLQAEARLPLPVEQMEMAWRTGTPTDGQVPVTIAAARKQPLQNFVENVRRFKPAKILLDCEPIVETWRNFFSAGDKFRRAEVVVSIAAKRTRVCLVENGQLSNAVNLDMGMDDFTIAQGPAEQTETVERFVQDTRSVLELFGYSDSREVPIFVLSDGGSVIETIVSSLDLAGLTAQTALPKIQKISPESRSLHAEDIYEYRVPMGLASMVLENRPEQFNIFEHLYSPAESKEKRRWLYSAKAMGAIALTMLFLLIAVLYADDVVSNRRLQRLRAQPDCKLLIQRQKLIKTVAQQRPDILQLLSQINADGSEGIMLDSFDFKKGQPVTINGQAKSTEELYKFQEALLSKKGIKEVKLQSAAKDSKSGKFKFTMTFHYRNLTKKRTRV